MGARSHTASTPLPNVFDYIDFRQYLRALFAALRRRDPRFSYRGFARLAGSSSPNFLQLILARKMAPNLVQLKSLATSVGLEGRGLKYLRQLVAFDAARTLEEKDRALRAALRIAREDCARVLTTEQYDYYTCWYHSAIRAALGFYRMKAGEEDYAELGALLQPPVAPQRVEESVALLKRLGLIRVDADGLYVQSEATVTTGDEVRAVQVMQYQGETMRLGIQALERCPPERRDISTLTLNISEAGFERIRERIRAFRKELMNIAECDANDDRVYQCNFQLFPLALPANEQEEA
ncbi:MAG: TIGR02147 family protein [Chitinivibrionales bacterium]|nr:TIGR02147 family protein [Chitinivibrionales bacterium]